MVVLDDITLCIEDISYSQTAKAVHFQALCEEAENCEDYALYETLYEFRPSFDTGTNLGYTMLNFRRKETSD